MRESFLCGDPVLEPIRSACFVFRVVFLSYRVRLNQGPFQVWEGAPGIRSSSRGHHRHVFLFKNYCVICKPKRDSNTETQAYVFKNMMKVGWAPRHRRFEGPLGPRCRSRHTHIYIKGI